MIETAFVKYSNLDVCDQPRADICIAFNGGKDCTALLHLVHSFAVNHTSKGLGYKILYICEDLEDTFVDVVEFVKQTTAKYNIEMISMVGSLKDALGRLIHQHPEIKAVFMGTRSTDPNAQWMSHFCVTSADWPMIDIVAPILHWSYHNVWSYLRSNCIDYCSLYDHGYTSIGRRSRTVPNPHLQIGTSKFFKPAYELEDGSLERVGRLL